MRKFSRPTHPVGLAPGTLREIAVEATPARIGYVDFTAEVLDEQQAESIEECFEAADNASTTTWIDIEGACDTETIRKLGDHFGLHPLLLEDITSVHQRSKVEQYGEATFIVVRVLEFDQTRREILSRQLSLVLHGRNLISFREAPDGLFEGVRNRLRTARPRIRTLGTGYLAYALLDAVVDHYFFILEELGDYMQTLETALTTNPGAETLSALHRLRRELIFLRKSVWPLRETIGAMIRDDDLPFADGLHVFLRDLHDHAVQVMETIDSYRDLNASMLETYLSLVSNRMNEVMKTLTVIATLFIPLTFIAGIYGMNFEHMPELRIPWAYPALWGLMITIAGGMLIYFRRRGWF